MFLILNIKFILSKKNLLENINSFTPNFEIFLYTLGSYSQFSYSPNLISNENFKTPKPTFSPFKLDQNSNLIDFQSSTINPIISVFSNFFNSNQMLIFFLVSSISFILFLLIIILITSEKNNFENDETNAMKLQLNEKLDPKLSNEAPLQI